MREKVGVCTRCEKEVYCTDGFLNGITLESGGILCFSCQERDPLVLILNQLLEAEKAGVETLAYLLSAYSSKTEWLPSFQQIKEDEAWSCAGLIRSIQREGGTASKQTGDFAQKVKAKETLEEKLALLNKGQSWVARKIDEALAFGMDERTRQFLTEMKRKHEDNVQLMSGFLSR